jgi:2-oxoglutarate ferredoxin oxidoreductase subunit gamma
MSQYEVLWAGFGGQGVMVAGQLLAYTGIEESKNVVWLPSYGPEMRGGTAYCMVVVSDARIGSPIIDSPQAACVFNRPSFDKFAPRIKPGGLLLVNSSLIDVTTDRTDIAEILVPANQMAIEAGSPKVTNVAMLGAFVGATGIVKIDNVEKVLIDKLGQKKALVEINRRVLTAGYELGRTEIKKARRKVSA